MQKQLNITVKGIVQGVGFRYFTKSTADQLGIKGWVRNLEDGSVEIKAVGEQDQLKVLLNEVKKGPRNSAVNSVEVADLEVSTLDKDFKITT